MEASLTAVFIILGVIVGLPVLSYMVMKFGRTGYLRADKEKRKQEKEE